MRLLTSFALLLALAAHGGESVQNVNPPGQRSFGSGKASGPLLTRAELRECLLQQERLRKADDAARLERQALDQEQAEIVRAGDELKQQLAALDRSSREAVDGYNARAAARDKMIDGFEARLGPFNARVEALQAERSGFAHRCENRRYDERDETAIKNGK